MDLYGGESGARGVVVRFFAKALNDDEEELEKTIAQSTPLTVLFTKESLFL